MTEAKLLGQLLVMQSIAISLPTRQSIIAFVCNGLCDIPGVKHVTYTAEIPSAAQENQILLPISMANSHFGTLVLEIASADAAEFTLFYDCIKNFAFVLAVIFKERNQRELNMRQQAELEAFSYSISHDLRTPLRHISGYVDLLSSRHATALDEKGKHYLDVIAASTKHMGELIDALLNFSRMNRAEVRSELVDMDALVEKNIAFYSETKGNRQISITITALPKVMGDSTLLNQVWTNLIGNAFKYTRQRDTTIITIGAECTAQEVIFFVKDNGAGFDMRYAEKLFGVFQRMHRQDEFEGTGIGLAISQRIITRHGGRIWAEATPQQGASFFFALPRIVVS